MTADAASGTLDVVPSRMEERRPMAVLMRLDTVAYGPLYIVVKSQYIGTKDGKLADHADYYFHSGTCPINYLRDIQRVAIDGDHDPHGLFKLVAGREWTPAVEEALNQGLNAEGLKELFETDGEPLPSDWH